jgi:hypothetical protein
MELLMYIIGICALAIVGFALLTFKDLIRYQIRKSREKKNGVMQAQTQTFPRILKRNLILLPLGVVGVLALYTLLALIIPPV